MVMVNLKHTNHRRIIFSNRYSYDHQIILLEEILKVKNIFYYE
jgi:hypothetical protein